MRIVRQARMLRLAVCAAIIIIEGTAAARIRSYQVTNVFSTTSPKPGWATYDSIADSALTRSAASDFDDNIVFDPIGYTMPYFQQQEASWFISSNGFLTPSNTALCAVFCSDATGYPYQLRQKAPFEFEFPSIQLYSGDLDPTSGNGVVLKRVFNKTYNSAEGAMQVGLVEFRDVQPYSRDGVLSTMLSAQAELWPNGTIVLRYVQRPSGIYVFTSGLAWTSTQRLLLNSTATVAVRLDPVLDTCNAIATCTPCANTSGCTWCNPQKLCVSTSVAVDYCAAIAQDTCELGVLPPFQSYYSVSQTDNDPANQTDAFLGDYDRPSSNATYMTSTNLTAALALPFRFNIFYNPPVPNASDPLNRSSVALASFGTLSFLGNAQSCAVNGYCSTGAYSYALLGVATENMYTAATSFDVSYLPERGPSDAACGVDAVRLGTTTCPEAVRIRVSQLSTVASAMRWSYVMLLDATGRIAIRYTRASSQTNRTERLPMANSPRPTFGLLRNGVSDTSSISIPWGSVAVGTTVVYTPLLTCDDCGVGGSCNRTSLACVCKPQFTGTTCSECTTGHYGHACDACPACGVHGVCNDGRNGFGTCTCTAPYSGAACETKCDQPPYDCPGCYGLGGYCLCGACVCNASRGWSGVNCSQWNDPCYQFSLDGCPVCTSYEPIQCRFCLSTSVCVADPVQSGIGTSNTSFSTCSLSVPGGNSLCREAVQSLSEASSAAVLYVLLTFGALGFTACFLFSCICACRRNRNNQLATLAVTGTANFQFAPREREVVQMVLVPPQGAKGRPVQGIPLKQTPLKALYLQQQERRKKDGGMRNVREWDIGREE